jgi:hypothetical protein
VKLTLKELEILLIDAEYSLEKAWIRLELEKSKYLFARKEAISCRRAMLVARNEELV